MAEFTPGPWEIEEGGQFESITAQGRDGAGWIVCDLGVHVNLACNSRDHLSENILDEISANARLIALAPTMHDYIASKAAAGCETALFILADITGIPA